jgi:hypothetical protein
MVIGESGLLEWLIRVCPWCCRVGARWKAYLGSNAENVTRRRLESIVIVLSLGDSERALHKCWWHDFVRNMRHQLYTKKQGVNNLHSVGSPKGLFLVTDVVLIARYRQFLRDLSKA